MGEAKRRRERFEITFIDSGREPQVAPNPDYPDGIDLDSTDGKPVQSCKVLLNYPAPRCGIMTVHCHRCGIRVAATVAGRRDDPRSLRIPCNPSYQTGATGEYPHGISQRPGDEGELAVAVSKPDSDGNMFIDFGKEVSWISLPREQVIELARNLAKQANASKVEIEP